MKTLLWIIALAVILPGAACNSQRGDPVAVEAPELRYGGSLTAGAGRANAAVTEQNKFAFCEQAFWPTYLAYVASLDRTVATPDTELARVTGNAGGYATVDSQLIVRSEYGGTQFTYRAKLVYYNYSDDGKLFFGGSIHYYGIWDENDGVTKPTEVTMNTGLNFAGDYEGLIEFLGFMLKIDQDGVLLAVGKNPTAFPTQGNVRITSNDVTMTFNPYPYTP